MAYELLYCEIKSYIICNDFYLSTKNKAHSLGTSAFGLCAIYECNYNGEDIRQVYKNGVALVV
jgi:hypothetical protein